MDPVRETSGRRFVLYGVFRAPWFAVHLAMNGGSGLAGAQRIPLASVPPDPIRCPTADLPEDANSQDTVMNKRRRQCVQILTMIGLAGLGHRTAIAHGTRHESGAAPGPVLKEQKPWGVAGDAKEVTRRIEIRMADTMRFSPSHIDVRLGETLSLRVVNRGRAMHEFVIGTRAELEAHAELMKRFPTMEHEEPYMAHVAPRRRRDIVWTFNRPGDFEFACLIPGHFEAGMRGTIRVEPRN